MALSIIATLTICVVAVGVSFALMYGIVARDLPLARADRLVWITSVRTDRTDAPFSLPEFVDLREQARTVRLLAYANWSASLETTASAKRIQGIKISANGFAVLGAKAQLGRLLRDADDLPDASSVVVLSYDFWLREFNGDRGIVGKRLILNGDPCTVVGVLPRNFPAPVQDLDVIVPLVPRRDPRLTQRASANFLRIIGRLADDASADKVEQELTAITAHLRSQYPVEYARKRGVGIISYKRHLVGDVRKPLMIVAVCTAIVIGIALLNVLNLLVVRALGRRAEFAVRRALGASARQLATELLAELATLTVVAGGLGAALVLWTVSRISSSGIAEIPRLDELRVDSTTTAVVCSFLFLTIALSTVVSLAFAIRTPPEAVLRTSVRAGTGTKRQRRLRSALLVAETALALVLTSAALSLRQSLIHLEQRDLGFRVDSVFIARLSLPAARSRSIADLTSFYDRLHSALRQTPSVVAGGMISVAPLSRLLATIPYVIPAHVVTRAVDRPSANFRAISPDYITAVRGRILEGRNFTESDDAKAPAVALVNRSFARKEFLDRTAVGQPLQIEDGDQGLRRVTIIGVLQDMQHVEIDGEPTPDIYIPLRQVQSGGVSFVSNTQFWAIRLNGDPAGFSNVFLSALRDIDPTVAASGAGPFHAFVDRALVTRRITVLTLSAFSLVAVVIAAIGVYSLMAYVNEQRRQEIGIRLALGASPANVSWLMLKSIVPITGLGIALGGVGSLMFSQALASLLFGTRPAEPSLLAAASILLAAVSVLASAPAIWRAVTLDPKSSLAVS